MQLKILTWNIWHGEHIDKVLEFLKNSQADIVALQEVKEIGITNQAAYLADNAGFKYKVYYRSVSGTKNGNIGNAIMSKYPITASEMYQLSDPALYQGTGETEPRIAVKTTISVNNSSITAISTHLAFSKNHEQTDIRKQQLEKLLEIITNEKIILMGDFNSYPDSETVQQIQTKLKNADTTFEPSAYLYKEGVKLEHRIDHIFVSNDISVVSCTVEQSDGSDHLPVSAVVEV